MSSTVIVSRFMRMSSSELRSHQSLVRRTQDDQQQLDDVPSTVSVIPIDRDTAKKQLFDVDHEENKRFVTRELEEIHREHSKKYNFNFKNDTPLKGSIVWESIPEADVPHPYRSSDIQCQNSKSHCHVLPPSSLSIAVTAAPTTSRLSRASLAKKLPITDSKAKRKLSFEESSSDDEVTAATEKRIFSSKKTTSTCNISIKNKNYPVTETISLPRVANTGKKHITEYLRVQKRPTEVQSSSAVEDPDAPQPSPKRLKQQ